jgi:hypothetical protein
MSDIGASEEAPCDGEREEKSDVDGDDAAEKEEDEEETSSVCDTTVSDLLKLPSASSGSEGRVRLSSAELPL